MTPRQRPGRSGPANPVLRAEIATVLLDAMRQRDTPAAPARKTAT